jgi:hypothetical protein
MAVVGGQATMSFSFAKGSVSRKVCIGILPKREAVHSLQRAILANIVMAWNTHHLQITLDRAPGGIGNWVSST